MNAAHHATIRNKPIRFLGGGGGESGLGYGTPVSYTVSLNLPTDAKVVLAAAYFSLDSGIAASIAVGGVSMVSTGVTVGGWTIYKLDNPPTGAVNFVVYGYAWGWTKVGGLCAAYAGCSSVGTPVAASGSGTALSQTTGSFISGEGAAFNIFAGAAAPSGYNKTTRGSYGNFVWGDAPGSGSTITFSATQTSGAWSSAVIPLNP